MNVDNSQGLSLYREKLRSEYAHLERGYAMEKSSAPLPVQSPPPYGVDSSIITSSAPQKVAKLVKKTLLSYAQIHALPDETSKKLALQNVFKEFTTASSSSKISWEDFIFTLRFRFEISLGDADVIKLKRFYHMERKQFVCYNKFIDALFRTSNNVIVREAGAAVVAKEEENHNLKTKYYMSKVVQAACLYGLQQNLTISEALSIIFSTKVFDSTEFFTVLESILEVQIDSNDQHAVFKDLKNTSGDDSGGDENTITLEEFITALQNFNVIPSSSVPPLSQNETVNG